MQNVPKFSSFKPKTVQTHARPTTSTSSQGPEEHQQPQDNSRRPDRDEGRHHGSSERRHKGRHHHRTESGRKRRQLAGSPPAAIPEQSEGLDKIVSIDRKGDKGNAQFGTNDSAKVPKYKAPADRKTLGKRWRDLDFPNQPKPLSSLPKTDLAAIQRHETFIAPQKPVDGDAWLNDLSLEYLPLRGNRKRKRPASIAGAESHAVPPETNFDDPASGRAHESDHSESSDATSESDLELAANEVHLETRMRQEHDRLLRTTREDSHNVQAWLDLADYQDDWVRDGLAARGSRHSLRDATTSAELKLAILSEALKVIPKSANGWERLLIRLMTVGRRLWSLEEQVERWNKLMSQSHGSPGLSLQYFNFVQTNDFSFERCRGSLIECLNSTVHTESAQPTSDRDLKWCKESIHLFHRLTIVLRDSGYQEQALALWQAILEIQFNQVKVTSAAPQYGTPELLELFAKFWDSEKPRIGESEDIQNSSLPSTDRPKPNTSGQRATKDLLVEWATWEGNTASRFSMPGRTSDDEDESGDPFHVVLSADIEPFLPFCIQQHDPSLLIDAFLSFFRLPPLPASSDCSNLSPWHTDGFTKSCGSSPLNNSNDTAGDYSPQHNTCVSALAYLHLFPATTDTLFTEPHQFSHFHNTQSRQIHIFLHNTLAALLRSLPANDNLASYFLAFETAIFPAQARKTAKGLLKQRSSQTQLWNAYALVEEQLGNTDAADRTLATAIKMNGSWEASGKEEVLLLWRTWIALAMRRGDLNAAVRRLAGMGVEANDLDRVLSADGPPQVDTIQKVEVVSAPFTNHNKTHSHRLNLPRNSAKT